VIFWGWVVVALLAGVLLGLLFAGLLYAAAWADRLAGDEDGGVSDGDQLFPRR
jgi:membrane-anchored glycerophosphoryl diester phosphodiesterase (GDPDase)